MRDLLGNVGLGVSNHLNPDLQGSIYIYKYTHTRGESNLDLRCRTELFNYCNIELEFKPTL